MNSAAEELTKSIGNSSWIVEWKKLEEVARTKRGEALMIYNVSGIPGVFTSPVIAFSTPYNGQLHHKQRKNKTSYILVERIGTFSGC
jgi:hypothetical protein